MKPSGNKIPKHVAIILDGNRRFSKRLMMKPWKGHEWGAKKIKSVLDWCKEFDIRELTLYTFSVENFNRPKKEFNYLMSLFREGFDKLKDDPRIYKNKIKVNVIGRIWMFPKDVQERMNYIIEKTKNHDKNIINFAMAYGGRHEVVDAVKKIAEQLKKGKLKIEDINEESFSRNLYMADEPDLIIRTGGEKRLSNFLPLQGAYSELIFLDKMWPEFEKEDFIYCMEEYSKRERRFGK